MMAVRLISTLLFAVVLCSAIGLGQLDRVDAGKDDAQAAKQAIAAVSVAGVPMNSVIDPDHYIVGPSDGIAVSIWISPAISFPLTVTPEGTLIIPTVGEVLVSGQSLSKAKVTIIAAVRKKYGTAVVTATLTKPRPVIVNVIGSVRHAGAYTLSAAYRVDGALAQANMLLDPRQMSAAEQQFDPGREMSQRNILVTHNDGTHDHVDIQKYLSTKVDSCNPYLREGDVVSVPKRNDTKNVVGVYGEVNVPGRYEFVEGDLFTDLVKIAQGFNRSARLDSIVLSRLSPDGSTMTNRIVTAESSEPLQPGDRIVVPATADQRQDFRVEVVGEVFHPGMYPITRNGTKLSEVIHAAGGFTESASLQTARIMRHSIPESQMENDRLYSLRGAAGSQDSLAYSVETALRLSSELVTADFTKIFKQNNAAEDVLLHDGDMIYVPSNLPTVYVFGQVVAPGYIPHVAGKDIRYYVERAGGFTDRARKGDIQIVKAGTKQWVDPDKTTIEPGDYVWVPMSPEHPFGYYMTVASQAATVLSVVIGIAVLIVQANK